MKLTCCSVSFIAGSNIKLTKFFRSVRPVLVATDPLPVHDRHMAVWTPAGGKGRIRADRQLAGLWVLVVVGTWLTTLRTVARHAYGTTALTQL
jgi:hypothetical protein